jgi:hypothetical protein
MKPPEKVEDLPQMNPEETARISILLVKKICPFINSLGRQNLLG